MTWTCEQIEERLTEYVDRLMPAAERDDFAGHLERCARCTALVERVSGLVSGLHALEPLEPPPRLARAILDATTGAEAAPRGFSRLAGWLRWLGPVAQPRFAMGVVTMALFFAVTIPALGIDVGKFQWSDLKPTNLYQALDRRANLMYARGVKFVYELRVVYEIQNMLQPASEKKMEGEKEQPSTQPEEQKPGQKTNRAREWETIPVMLATTATGLPGRNN